MIQIKFHLINLTTKMKALIVKFQFFICLSINFFFFFLAITKLMFDKYIVVSSTLSCVEYKLMI